MNYHGQMALQIAILVAFTQLIPEHQVQVLGVIKARVKVRQIPSTHWTIEPDLFADFTNGLPYLIDCFMLRGIPMPLDHHSIWLVCWLDLLAILQEKHR